MWREAERCFDAHRRALALAGMPVAAALEPAEGLLCAYTPGVIRLSLPDPDTLAGRWQATLLGGLMGVAPREVGWLFGALLPRLVAHELGHALRHEAGRLGPDVREEEQVADRLGDLLSRPNLGRADRARATALLGDVLARLGGAPEAAALHRRAAEARDRLGLRATDEGAARARAHLQEHYHRDVAAYLRTSVAWAWIDLSLDTEDTLDAFHRDHIALAS